MTEQEPTVSTPASDTRTDDQQPRPAVTDDPAADTGEGTGAVDVAAGAGATDTTAETGDGPAEDEPALAGGAWSRMLEELRAVTWPTRRQFTTYTAVVVGFLVVATGLVGAVDTGFSALILRLLG